MKQEKRGQKVDGIPFVNLEVNSRFVRKAELFVCWEGSILCCKIAMMDERERKG